jgi:predicted nucleic acid-binding protein
MTLPFVVDTNVFLSALRSRRGAAFRLLSLVDRGGKFEVNVSVPLVLEYEEVAKRQLRTIGLSSGEVDDIIDYLCSVANLLPVGVRISRTRRTI